MVTKEAEGRKGVSKNFAENWSVTGYRYIYFDTGIRRCIWFVLLLASLVFGVYLFYGSIIDYIDYSSYNVDSVNYDVTTIEFPTVTTCNINSLNIKKARASGITTSIKEFQSKYGGLVGSLRGNNTVVDDQWFVQNNISTVKEALNVFEANYDDMTDDPVVRSIQPGGACIFNSDPCNRIDIQDTISWETSLCHEFNSFDHRKASKKSFSVGMRDGLDMVFNIDADNSMISNYPFQGLELLIHPFGTPHFIQEYTDVVVLQPGTMNIITIEGRTVRLTYLFI